MFKIAFAACAGFVIMATTAEAQSRKPLYIDVKPRSWLDPGTSVPVGSMQNYIYDTQGVSGTNGGARFSNQGLLPDRFSGGRPFTVNFPAPEILR